MTETVRPILYSFRRCPYAMRARLALHVAAQPVEHREVLLRDKPAELQAASAKATVPVLVLPDGQVIDESLSIMKWALTINDPEQWLDQEKGSTEEVATLIEHNDGPFKSGLDRYKYANRFPGADSLANREAAAQFVWTLNGRLAASPALFGTRPGLADMAIAPFVRQFAMTDPQWFRSQRWSMVSGWLDAILQSSRFADVMHKYPRWTGQARPQLSAARQG